MPHPWEVPTDNHGKASKGHILRRVELATARNSDATPGEMPFLFNASVFPRPASTLQWSLPLVSAQSYVHGNNQGLYFAPLLQHFSCETHGACPIQSQAVRKITLYSSLFAQRSTTRPCTRLIPSTFVVGIRTRRFNPVVVSGSSSPHIAQWLSGGFGPKHMGRVDDNKSGS